MDNSNDDYVGFIVSQTHWDREWYLTFEEFRRWLVRMIDDLLDNLEKYPRYKSFMLDGQTLPIEDYLEIRPEREADFKKQVKAGRIIVGPFYVLADEFCESGEAMIRNLLIGHKIAEKYGKQMKVGYVPDTFGHIWQLPQILRSFGINYMYYYRGYPPVFGNHQEYKGFNDDTALEHLYQSPNGDSVLALHHITGYGNASGITEIKVDMGGAFPYSNGVQRIFSAYETLKQRSLSKTLLLQNGTDHRQAEWDLPDFIEKWNNDEEIKEDLEIHLVHGTLEDYFKKVEAEKHNFPVLTGELRGSMYTQVTAGCISTRMYLKQQNWTAQTELEKYSEPLAALAKAFGGNDQAAYIEKAWKWVLQNHPHDSICGCSLDRVHDDMESRYAWAMDLASDVSNYALAQIISAIDKEAIIKALSKQLNIHEREIKLFIVFNPNSFTGGFSEDYIDIVPDANLKIYSSDGKQIVNTSIQLFSHYQYQLKEGQYLYKKFQSNFSLAKIAFYDPDLPALGYKVYAAVNHAKINNEIQTPSLQKSYDFKEYKITLNDNGSINIFDKETEYEYIEVNSFEDGADDGDEYDYAPLKQENLFYSTDCKATWSINQDSELYIEITADLDFNIPEKLIGDLNTDRVRSENLVPLHIKSTYRFFKNLKRIDVKTEFENKMTGHRLRALVPSGLKTENSFADDHFMVMKRTVELPKDDGWYQDMQGIYNQSSFTDINDGTRGIALFNKGLIEYEIVRNFPKTKDKNTIALTLMRSVEWLSQKGHLGRKSGLNGPNLRTFGSQCLRPFTCEYSIYPHKSNWENGNVYKMAHLYEYPSKLLPFSHRLRNDTLPIKLDAKLSIMENDNPKLIYSSLKNSWEISDSKPGRILRFYNPTETIQSAKIKILIPFSQVSRCNMLEQAIGSLNIIENIVDIEVKPSEIYSLHISDK